MKYIIYCKKKDDTIESWFGGFNEYGRIMWSRGRRPVWAGKGGYWLEPYKFNSLRVARKALNKVIMDDMVHGVLGTWNNVVKETDEP